MTRDELIAAAQAGEYQDGYAKRIGVPLEHVKHACRVNRVDWRKERNKNVEVRLNQLRAAHKANSASAEKRKCQKFPK